MSAYCKISDRCRCVSERDICPNWITPPTETPAPLSEDALDLMVQRLRDSVAAHEHCRDDPQCKGYLYIITNADVDRDAATAISDLRAQVAALTAEVKGWRDAAYLSACESDSGIGMDELREQNAAQAAELAQARKAMAWRPIEEAPPNLPYPVAYGWYPNIVGLARRVNSEWQSVIDDGGDFVPISEPDLFLVLPALATPPAPSGSPEEEKEHN